MACPRFFPALDQSSKMSVLPAPVGACTTTSLPSRKNVTACCCQRSGMATWFSPGAFSNCSASVRTTGTLLKCGGMEWVFPALSLAGIGVARAGIGFCLVQSHGRPHQSPDDPGRDAAEKHVRENDVELVGAGELRREDAEGGEVNQVERQNREQA